MKDLKELAKEIQDISTSLPAGLTLHRSILLLAVKSLKHLDRDIQNQKLLTDMKTTKN